VWILNNWSLDYSSVLDLAAGGGEISRFLISKGYDNIEGIDPYTHDLYKKVTGKECKKSTFEEIAMKGFNKEYSTIFCSYALHLIEPSYLETFLWQVQRSCKDFIILSPNKRPYIEDSFLIEFNNVKIGDVRVRWFKTS
jgi:2-polyprenyl-3-methyl-5-hydroxy-6-metoxy-1,4-benzoquinol methylase